MEPEKSDNPKQNAKLEKATVFMKLLKRKREKDGDELLKALMSL